MAMDQAGVQQALLLDLAKTVSVSGVDDVDQGIITHPEQGVLHSNPWHTDLKHGTSIAGVLDTSEGCCTCLATIRLGTDTSPAVAAICQARSLAASSTTRAHPQQAPFTTSHPVRPPSAKAHPITAATHAQHACQPLDAVSTSDNGLAVLLPSWRYRLGDVLRFSPALLRHAGMSQLLLLQALTAARDHQLQHGSPLPLRADDLQLTSTLWLQHVPPPWLAIARPPPPPSLHQLTAAWQQRQLTTFDYLLHINALAGRRWGDPACHPIMPWTLDMTQHPEHATPVWHYANYANNPVLLILHGTCSYAVAQLSPPPPFVSPQGAGWRDLSQTKYRLAKGDTQLDLTYAMSERSHHVSDQPLSDVAFCIYKARRLPQTLLTATVRAVFEPNEYPVSIARLYATTPDEAIPEFYCQPSVFVSLHQGMRDMAVPDWADGDPATFVTLHRAALESDYVSQHLHLWIDVTFGVALTGQAAVAAKNVALGARDRLRPLNVGRCQVFSAPHPPRAGCVGSDVGVQGSAVGRERVPGVQGSILDVQAWMRYAGWIERTSHQHVHTNT